MSMMTTIGLAGRERKRVLVLFVVASVFGGSAMAVTAWLAGIAVRAALPAPATWMALPLGILAVALLWLERGPGPKWSSPAGPKRQVCSMTIQRRGATAAAVSWGFQLGLGTITRVNTWALWAFLGATALLLPVSLALGVGCTYGLTRGLQPTVAAFRPPALVSELTTGFATFDRKYWVGALFGLILALAINRA
jgi:hypothetical protein